MQLGWPGYFSHTSGVGGCSGTADSTSSCGVLLKSVSVGCVSQSVAVCFARESACGCTLETSYNDREAVTINLTCQGVSLCLHVCARTQLFVELHPQYTYICPPVTQCDLMSCRSHMFAGCRGYPSTPVAGPSTAARPAAAIFQSRK